MILRDLEWWRQKGYKGGQRRIKASEGPGAVPGSGQLAAEVKIFDEINAIFIKLHISVRNTFYHQVIYITQYILPVEQDILNQSKRSAPLHAFVVTVGTDTSAPGHFGTKILRHRCRSVRTFRHRCKCNEIRCLHEGDREGEGAKKSN